MAGATGGGSGMEALRERIALLPRQPGVYLWKDAAGTILYVGKAKEIQARVRTYLSDPGEKQRALVAAASGGGTVDYIAVATVKEALILEQTLIKRHKPRFNVRLTDGKQYPYLKLTTGAWPRLIKVYKYLDDGATYFGPFPDGYGAYHLMRVVNDLVPLRRCRTLPKQKCLYYDIGKCVGPCIDACTEAEYEALVDQVRALFAGGADQVARRLRVDMQAAAERADFEEAARLRDQLQSIQSVMERQHVLTQRLEDRDVAAIARRGDEAVVTIVHQRDGNVVGQSPFQLTGTAGEEDLDVLAEFLRGYYADQPAVPRHVAVPHGAPAAALEEDLRSLAGHAVTVETPQRGEKTRWLGVAQSNADLRLEEELHKRSRRGMGAVEALQGALGLPAPPRIIEGFDISHHAGAHTRAAMVRFVDGEPDKPGYRTFNMKTVGEAAVEAGTATVARGAGREVDDFASMGEAVGRRYRGLAERGEELPDLVLIDGGPGQLAAAVAALKDVGVPLPVASLAKREEEVYLPGRMTPVRLTRRDPALQLLQRVRDESHRFGITQVRRKATASAAASPLDRVKGIGPKRRQELIKAFGGLEGLRAASVDDLQRVPGVSAAVAERVVAALTPP